MADVLGVTLNLPLQNAINGVSGALSALVTGDLPGMFENLILALPVVGAFMVIYFLVYFMGVISIFKDQEHHKFAKMIGAGIAMIGILNHAVMQLLVGFAGGAMLIIGLLILVVSFIIGKYMKARKSYLEGRTSGHQAKAAELEAYRASSEQDHESAIETKAQRNELKTVQKAEKFMDEEISEDHNSIQAIDNMIKLLNKIGAVGNDVKSRERLQNVLTRNISQFSHLLNDEYHGLEKLDESLKNLKKTDLNSVNLEAKTARTVENRLRKYFAEVLGKRVESNASAEHKKAAVDYLLKTELANLEKLKAGAFELDKERVLLDTQLSTFVENEEKFMTGNILNQKNQLLAHLHAGDYPASIASLQALRADFVKLGVANKRIDDQLAQLEVYHNKRKQLEDLFDEIVTNLTSHKLVKHFEKGDYHKAQKFLEKVNAEEHKAADIENSTKKKEKKSESADKKANQTVGKFKKTGNNTFEATKN